MGVTGHESELRTERTTFKRVPQRGSHDFETVAGVFDEAVYCNLGFAVDGQPFVVPMIHGRDGRALYLHGSVASRAVRTLSQGVPVCVTATLLDGLVLARSAFHHSVNYRSAMIFGVAREVAGEEKLRGLEVIVEHMVRGRWAEVRPPSAKELKATAVLRLDIEEASAKVRQGPPIDDEEDYALACWAGVIPLPVVPQAPIPDARLPPGAEPPHVRHRNPEA